MASLANNEELDALETNDIQSNITNGGSDASLDSSQVTPVHSHGETLDSATIRCNGHKLSDDETESPVVKLRNTTNKRAIISDSDEEVVKVKSNPRKRRINSDLPSPQFDSRVVDRVQHEFLSNKELSLRSLMDMFPKLDLMLIQDTLCLCSWNSSKAAHILKDNCNPTTCKHILDKPESPKEEPVPPSPQATASPLPKLSALTDEVSSWLTKPNVQKAISTVRRRIQELSSSEDDQSREAANNVNNQCDSIAEDKISKSPQHSVKRQAEHELSDDENRKKKECKPVSNINGSASHHQDRVRSKVSDRSEKRNKSKQKHNSKSKKKKRRDIDGDSDEYDDDYGKDNVYDSDDSDIDETETPARLSVIKFFNESTKNELLAVAGLSQKKLDNINNLRPFQSWVELVKKFQNDKQLSTDLLNGARAVIHMREVMNKLMAHCEKYSKQMEKLFSKVKSCDDDEVLIKEQPSILNANLKLAPYQMIGLNWLYLMHMQELNGILADEMGLGKTIQAIAFLSHLLEKGEKGPHLIVVPSSTLDNWIREIETWCDSLIVIAYRGSQQDRKELRLQLVNKEIEEFHIILTTYNMVGSSPEDRALFKRLSFNYVIFDEAHMLKNMATVRYKNLMGIGANRRLCLTGTPLQNNLVELMSLLIFVMPDMFNGKIDQVRKMFTTTCKSEEGRSSYEKNRIEHAKQIMKPFVLRRLKSEVLTELPQKRDSVRYCVMTENQKRLYDEMVNRLKPEVMSNAIEKSDVDPQTTGGISMVMDLRKLANHPLLKRNIFADSQLKIMATKLMKEPIHQNSQEKLIFEDLQVLSDFDIHKLCLTFKSIKQYALKDEDILDSGKFVALGEILAEWKEKGERVLLFSQFVIVLDIIEEYMKIKNHKYVRLDGSTKVGDRQDLIDNFTTDQDVFVFLLSTRAGGLGINLTAANVVVLHDIDYNPYNDKQAEDRCHRVGQTREVTVIRMISKSTIEEGMLHCAQEKLRLEKNITSTDNTEEPKSVASNLLKSALGFSQ